MSLTTNIRVHARQLAFKPNLQIIRRSRRPLLRGLEQARRSALAHHVPRIAPMGARVLINGTRYKCHQRDLCRSSAAVCGSQNAGTHLLSLITRCSTNRARSRCGCAGWRTNATRYGSWSRLKRAEPLAHRCVATAKPSVASNETIVGHIGRNPIMKAWSIISLLFAAAILATIPISPQVTPRGLELRVDEAGAVTY